MSIAELPAHAEPKNPNVAKKMVMGSRAALVEASHADVVEKLIKLRAVVRQLGGGNGAFLALPLKPVAAGVIKELELGRFSQAVLPNRLPPMCGCEGRRPWASRRERRPTLGGYP